jgi:hypoxanthine-DNA glycosylase
MPPKAAGTIVTKRSFDPVIDKGTRVLILGSLPGEISLAQAQYYAYPRNQFWRLVGAVINEDISALGYEQRLSALLAAGIGLWDVIESASRAGSLDANIRDHRPNQLVELAGTLPHLNAIAFNGGTSAAIGRRQLATLDGPALIALPSSSPAYTAPFEQKRAAWMQLRPYLDSSGRQKSVNGN